MAGNPALIVRVAATIEELRKNLAEGKSQIETTTAAMGRLASSFSGDKLIQAAQNTVAAVNSIGGATKLSGAEQERVNVLLEKALEKYRLLGREAPAGMQKLADETKSADKASSGLSDTVKSLAIGFAAMFTARAAFNFAKGVLDDASALKDLSQQTHMTVEEIQILAGAMSEFGVDQDTLAKALFTLSRKVAGGDDSVAKALATMGMSLQDLDGLEGRELFLKIEHGLSTLQGGLRDTTASEIFGSRLGMAMAGASDGIDGAIETWQRLNHVASTESVDALDKYDEAIKRAEKSLTAMAANMMGPVAEGFNVLFDAASKGASKWDLILGLLPKGLGLVGTGTEGLATVLDHLNIATDKGTVATTKHAAAHVDVGPKISATALASAAAAEKAAAAAAATAKLNDELERLRDDSDSMIALTGFRTAADARQTETTRQQTTAINDLIVAELKRKQSDQEFLDTEVALAKATDLANLAMGNAPAAIKPIKPALDEATQAAGVFMQQLTMLVTDPNTAGFFGLDAKGSVAQTLFGGGANGLTPEMAAAMAAGQFINTAGVGSVQRRAGGGPVRGGSPYLVGERGPEMFVPGSSGSIVPNGGGGATVVNVYVTQPLGTPDQIMRVVGPAVMQALRNGGTRMPVGS